MLIRTGACIPVGWIIYETVEFKCQCSVFVDYHGYLVQNPCGGDDIISIWDYLRMDSAMKSRIRPKNMRIYGNNSRMP